MRVRVRRFRISSKNIRNSWRRSLYLDRSVALWLMLSLCITISGKVYTDIARRVRIWESKTVFSYVYWKYWLRNIALISVFQLAFFASCCHCLKSNGKVCFPNGQEYKKEYIGCVIFVCLVKKYRLHNSSDLALSMHTFRCMLSLCVVFSARVCFTNE